MLVRVKYKLVTMQSVLNDPALGIVIGSLSMWPLGFRIQTGGAGSTQSGLKLNTKNSSPGNITVKLVALARKTSPGLPKMTSIPSTQ